MEGGHQAGGNSIRKGIEAGKPRENLQRVFDQFEWAQSSVRSGGVVEGKAIAQRICHPRTISGQ